ncbi:hypothetical protein PGB90_000645 [Kerria lacca]
MSENFVVTATAPVNIATIKYWGKKDEKLIIPVNDSISATLSSDYMCAKTTIAISPNFEKDQIWLNGIEESIENPRLLNCIRNIKNKAKIGTDKLKWKIHICSENNFPTAAGLASSSAGYACLVYALSHIYNVKENISDIARQGSGSACRSIYGGFVQWYTGIKNDGSDSIALQLAPASHWPEMRVIILVVNDKQKKTSSTIGMQRTVETSKLLHYRVKYCVQGHIDKMIQAIKNKNFDLFAEITMRDSNQFHAVCLDTYPPAIYMNDTSHAIASFVHEYNAAANSYKVAYTFDAGPNACLFTLEKNVPALLYTITKVFPTSGSVKDYITGIPINIENKSINAPEINISMQSDLLKYVIYTKVGEGPTLLPDTESLLNREGLPLRLA